MTQRTATQKRPGNVEDAPPRAIACHGAIHFLPRINRFTTGYDEVYTCDSGCREGGRVGQTTAHPFKMASGFVQILDHDPIPLCAACLREARARPSPKSRRL